MSLPLLPLFPPLYTPVHIFPPLPTPDGDTPRHARGHDQEPSADGAEPTDANRLDSRETDGGTGGREHISEDVVARDDLCAPRLHDVQAVRVQARKAEQLGDALQEHDDDGQRDATFGLLDAPAVDEHAGGDDDAEGEEAAAQAVLGHAVAVALADPLAHRAVGPAAAEEGAEEVSAAGRDVEEAGLDGAGEVEARVEHVPDRRQEGVHVPDQTAAREAGDEQVRVPVEAQDAHRVRPRPQLGGVVLPAESLELDGALAVDGLGQAEGDEEGGEAREGRLQPEDVPPTRVRDDDAADERPESRADECAGQEPRERGGAVDGPVNVADAAAADD